MTLFPGHGKASRANRIDDGALGGADHFLVCVLAACVACVSALALSSLAFRIVPHGFVLSCPSQIPAMCHHRNLVVLQDIVSGVRESLPRSFVSRIRVALAGSDSSSCCGDEDVGISDSSQVFSGNVSPLQPRCEGRRRELSLLHLFFAPAVSMA